MIECKIELPNGSVYMKGVHDPVADLVLNLTLTNKTTERRTTERSVTNRNAEMLNKDDVKAIRKIAFDNIEKKGTVDDYKAKLNEYLLSKIKETNIKQRPINNDRRGPAGRLAGTLRRRAPPHSGRRLPLSGGRGNQASELPAGGAASRPRFPRDHCRR